MKKIVVTSGRKYIDIDAYAGIFAYRDLLKHLGYEAYAVTSAYINESISKSITDIGFQFDNIVIDNKTEFIVLDVSNPKFFDTFVNQEKIIEIIDHHIGYEEYWNQRKVNNQIEFIGSICTIIFERYVKSGKENLLTPNLCKILIAGILDNTLNLKSKNTTQRDVDTCEKLFDIGKINRDWGSIYFHSCYNNVEENLEEMIKNDIKVEKTSSVLPDAFGQLIVLDINTILNNIGHVFNAFKDYSEWIFNVVSLEDGKSYLFFSNSIIKGHLLSLFASSTLDYCLVLNNCMLRKEIIKTAKEYDDKAEMALMNNQKGK